MAGVLFWVVAHALAFSAGGPVGTAIVIGIWLFVSYLPGKKAAAREEARLFDDLDFGNAEGFGPSISTRIDFEQMTMTSRVVSIDLDRTEVHELRRDGAGWASRLTSASQAEELARLRRLQEEAGGDAARGLAADRIEETERNDWSAFDGHIASRVEVAYQRYLRTL